MSDETQRRLGDARRAVEEANQARDTALATRDEAMLAARTEGAMQREIAELLGMATDHVGIRLTARWATSTSSSVGCRRHARPGGVDHRGASGRPARAMSATQFLSCQPQRCAVDSVVWGIVSGAAEGDEVTGPPR